MSIEPAREDSKPTPSTTAALPAEAEKALEKVVQEGGPKALLAVIGAFSRTTNFGPDPETARILAARFNWMSSIGR